MPAHEHEANRASDEFTSRLLACDEALATGTLLGLGD
jgi:hypothetical protein